MRDPARQQTILDALAKVWANEPDIRLCQLLIGIVAITNRGNFDTADIFYYEDSRLLDALNEYCENEGLL